MNIFSFIKQIVEGVKALKKMDWYQRGEVATYTATAACGALHLRHDDYQGAAIAAGLAFLAGVKLANQAPAGTVALPAEHPAAIEASKKIVAEAKVNAAKETAGWNPFSGK